MFKFLKILIRFFQTWTILFVKRTFFNILDTIRRKTKLAQFWILTCAIFSFYKLRNPADTNGNRISIYRPLCKSDWINRILSFTTGVRKTIRFLVDTSIRTNTAALDSGPNSCVYWGGILGTRTVWWFLNKIYGIFLDILIDKIHHITSRFYFLLIILFHLFYYYIYCRCQAY